MSRELDAKIATAIFGYTLDYEFADLMFDKAPCVKELRDQYDEWGMLPNYSTDIAAAWLVVDKLCDDRGWFFDLGNKPSDPDDMTSAFVWNAFFRRTIVGPDAPTPAEAICLAALKAVDEPPR